MVLATFISQENNSALFIYLGCKVQYKSARLLGDWHKGQMNNRYHFHLYVAFEKLDHASLASDRQVECPI